MKETKFTSGEEFLSFLETLERDKTEWKLVPVSTLTLGLPVVTDISQAVRRDYTLSLPTGEVYLVPDGYATSIFQRSALYGNALNLLPQEVVVDVENKALAISMDNTKLLIRKDDPTYDGRCLAAHSELYAPISQLDIFSLSDSYFSDWFEGEFKHGFFCDDFTEASYKLKSKTLLKEYVTAFARVGKKTDFTGFSAAVTTSDVGISKVNISVYGNAGKREIPFGTLSTKHFGNNTIEQVQINLNEIFPLIKSKAETMAQLAALELAHPENVLIQLFKKLKFAKKISTKLYDRYANLHEGIDTALNIYLELTEYISELKAKGTDAMSIVEAEGKLAALTADDFKSFDLPGTFTWAA